VYVAAADGYLYAMNASDGGIQWRALVVKPGQSQNLGYNWSSPTVVGGHIYMGVSAQCDHPLIRGGLKEYDQHTGALQAVYWTVPQGNVGGSIWTSALATSNDDAVYVTTGNGQEGDDQGDSYSMVQLDPVTLAKVGIWSVPGLIGTDDDFGASPSIFNGTINGQPTALIGACNKNGTYSALKQTDLASGPVWTRQLSTDSEGYCLSSSAWDNSRLYAGSNNTIINGTHYFGSIRELDPSTGLSIWEAGLPGTVVGTPVLNGANVLAVPISDYTNPGATNAVYLFNAATGANLAIIDTSNDPVYAQPVLAGAYLLVATQDNGMTAYTP